MNDEVRQIREETFDYIILGGIGLSLVAGLAILIIEGPASAWFVRVMALLLIMGIAWIVRFIGKPALAVYVLVVQLVGLVAETFLHTSTITTFVPYLLIPIMLIASFFVLGGDFWDKIRALFIYGATVTFPPKPAAT